MNKSFDLRVLTALGLIAFASSISDLTVTSVRAQERISPNEASEAVEKAAKAFYEGIRTETLPNGLRVYLKPVPDSPVVTTMVAYKVGSADEELSSTGLSHYLEHLMFKGTEKILPGDIDRTTLRNGGANNAYTSEDYTVYHFDFAADRWQSALEIEADRMRNLRIDAKHEFEQEKGAVIEELERNEDSPWDLEGKAILPLLYNVGAPYGHPVIGERRHVLGATAEIIKSHYDRWYCPNNASLVVCGGFDPDLALEKIKTLFGTIPSKTLPERKTVPEKKRDGPVHKNFESKFDVPRMLMGFNTVKTADPDYYPLEIIQGILTGGKTGRLYKKLVEGEEIAGVVGSSNLTGRYPGWFSVQVELLKGKDRKKVENLVLEELKKLADEQVGDAELNRVKQVLLASAIYDRESVHGLADTIARGVTTNDLEFLKTYLPRIAGVTAAQIKESATKFFNPDQRVVVWSIPGEKPGQGAGARSGLLPLGRKNREQKAVTGGGVAFSLKDAKEVVLDNGLRILLFENHRLPIVVARAYVPGVRLHEEESKNGLASLTGRLLDEGTAKHSGPQIAETIENVGGNLTMSLSGGTVRVLTPYKSLGLNLLFECLSEPSFPAEAFQREKQRLLSEIDDAEQQPDSRAQMIYQEMVYGKHPLGRPALGRHKTVEALQPSDCISFHRKLFVPGNVTVAVVGDFDTATVVDEVKKQVGSWTASTVPAVQVPEVVKSPEFTQKIVTMPDAAQLHFLMGQGGIRRDNPDYYKLLVMDYVLGTGPGFTDRLSARLRDRKGLAYTVEANITRSASEEPGTFTCYIGTRPSNFALVKSLFLEELNRLREEKPSGEEVEDAKKYLLGNLPFQVTTNEKIAEQLLYIQRYHLGFSYLDDYQKMVAAVTPQDVHVAARKYLDPQHMILVAVGAIDAQGKAFDKLPQPRENNK